MVKMSIYGNEHLYGTDPRLYGIDPRFSPEMVREILEREERIFNKKVWEVMKKWRAEEKILLKEKNELKILREKLEIFDGIKKNIKELSSKEKVDRIINIEIEEIKKNASKKIKILTEIKNDINELSREFENEFEIKNDINKLSREFENELSVDSFLRSWRFRNGFKGKAVIDKYIEEKIEKINRMLQEKIRLFAEVKKKIKEIVSNESNGSEEIVLSRVDAFIEEKIKERARILKKVHELEETIKNEEEKMSQEIKKLYKEREDEWERRRKMDEDIMY